MIDPEKNENLLREPTFAEIVVTGLRCIQGLDTHETAKNGFPACIRLERRFMYKKSA